MNDARRILLLSTSTVHGSDFLEYCTQEIASHFQRSASVLFVPFASPGGMSHDEYTDRVARQFATIGLAVQGIHSSSDPAAAIADAAGLFIGGGNTFLLLRELYRQELLHPIRSRVEAGMPYMGSSAGSNVAGMTIGTTNDMPIVHTPSFDALGLVPFNLNPHYIDPDPDSTHMGETRATRIREFHVQNAVPVIGLREGAWLRVTGDEMRLEGLSGARLFRRGQEPEELAAGSDVSDLLEPEGL
jgi:dipeptidase E